MMSPIVLISNLYHWIKLKWKLFKGFLKLNHRRNMADQNNQQGPSVRQENSNRVVVKIEPGTNQTLTPGEPTDRVAPQDHASGANARPSPQMQPNQIRPDAQPINQATYRCCICMNAPYVDPVTAMCGHVFCRVCLTSSLRIRQNCPKCNRHIRPMRGVRRIFFEWWSRSLNCLYL